LNLQGKIFRDGFYLYDIPQLIYGTSLAHSSRWDGVMYQISSVLAETTGATGTNVSNVTNNPSAVRKTTDAGEITDFSFSDFLDMINPLEHIPVISSVYREITNEKIKPVSRVAGDILYGGIIGVGSAIISGLGSAADSVSEAENGKDAIGSMVASLFGDDEMPTVNQAQPTQLATTEPTPTSTFAPATETAPAPVTVDNQVQFADDSAPSATVAEAQPAATVNAATAAPTAPTNIAKLQPQNKLPFGGVMAPSIPLTRQDHAALLNDKIRSQRVGGTLFSARQTASLSKTQAAQPFPAVQTTSAQATQEPVTNPTDAINASAAAALRQQLNDLTTGSGAGGSSVPSQLSDDQSILKALSQYSGVASRTSSSRKGQLLDSVN
jgi:hypothetical protein